MEKTQSKTIFGGIIGAYRYKQLTETCLQIIALNT